MILKFRSSFSIKTKLGIRRKFLNKRTKQFIEKINSSAPIVIIDINYIEFLISKKKKQPNSNISTKRTTEFKTIENWFESIFKLITPKGVIFIAEAPSEFTTVLEYPVIFYNIKNFIYSIKTYNKITDPIVLVSNNLELWSLASNTSELSFIAINSNNRLLHYNNNTGLEIISKFIGTYKIINKLGLSHLKYINLQYLYILLFYIYKTNKTDSNFFFDGKYFRNKFLNSNGLGLSLISDAHKFLSYSFLTKPEFLDYFLLGNDAHYILQLSRLLKLLPLDIKILQSLKQTYDISHKPKLIQINIPNMQPSLSNNLKYYTMIWNNVNMCNNFIETKKLMRLLRKYNKLYNISIKSLLETFPKSYKKNFIPNTKKEPVTDITNDIKTYISNLISGVF